MNAVIDNDILFKGACYGLLSEVISTVCSTPRAGVLGSARFVVPKRIERAALNRDRATALETLLSFLNDAEVMEPRDDEQRLAADLELAAKRLGVNLDNGESQLCAVLVQRLVPLLLTGDKRAIAAMEALLDTDPRLMPLCAKVKCLEQMVAEYVMLRGCAGVRLAVCAEPAVDKALSICFSCRSESAEDASILEGLQSYISNLRRFACRVLAP